MRTTILVMGLFVLALSVLAGCGGDGDSSGVTVSGPTKAVFVREAQTLCRRGTKARNSALQGAMEKSNVATESNPEAVKKVLIAHVVPIYERTVEELSQLTPPDEGEEQFEDVMAALEATAAELHQNPLANTALLKAAKVTAAYGIPACGE
jgi:hypothetical protein